jgi:hypothetical protein
MLPADAELNVGTMKAILGSGHSRVPVHRPGNRRAPSPLSRQSPHTCGLHAHAMILVGSCSLTLIYERSLKLQHACARTDTVSAPAALHGTRLWHGRACGGVRLACRG